MLLKNAEAIITRGTTAVPTPAGSAPSMVQVVVEGIIEGVMKGRYAPGQRLIASDLAEEFSVSRAPVREALHVLAGEGVVDLIPNRGAKIRRLSVQYLVDFLEFTEAICSLGVRSAAPKMRVPECRRELITAFRTIEDAWERRDSVEFVNSLYVYHMTLNRISGNHFVDFFYRRPYFKFFNRLLSDLVPGAHWDQYIASYRRIHETILNGEPETAVMTFSNHIKWVLKIMQEAAEARA